MKIAIPLLFISSMFIFYNVYINSTLDKKINTRILTTVNQPNTTKIIKVDNDTISDLIESIIHVESRGDSLAYNSSSQAAGCMQIRPIMVREVNRILSKSDSDIRYTMADRYSRVKSVEMFHIWRRYHHKKSPMEKIARCWNGGGRGHLMNSTHGYWIKVRSRISN